MAELGRLMVTVGADISDLESGLDRAAGRLRNVGGQFTAVGAGLSATITAPLLGVATAAIRAGGALNSGLANVASLGVATDRVMELKGAVQEMAVDVGKRTGDLTDGLYQVISAFGDTADTVAILEINAKAAAAGLATTTDAINLTSAVTKGYGDTSAEAVQKASDLAFTTVQLGQTTFPELARSIGLVVPLASSLGVEMESLFGVMATATGVTGTASEVATQLRGILQSLMAPTAQMTELYTGMGFATSQAMLNSLGLQGTIEAIVDAAAKSGEPLQKYISSIEGQTLALALAGPQADVFTAKLGAMEKAAGATDAAFAAQTEGVNANGFAWTQAQIKLEIFLQKLSDGLAPAVSAALDVITPLGDRLIGLADAFLQLDPATQRLILGAAGVAVALGPMALAAAAAMQATAALLPIVSTLAGVLAAVVSPAGLALGALAAVYALDVGGVRTQTEAIGSLLAAFARSDDVARAAGTIASAIGEIAGATIGLLTGAVSFASFGATVTAQLGNIKTAITDLFSGQAFGELTTGLADKLGLTDLVAMLDGPLSNLETLLAGPINRIGQAITNLGAVDIDFGGLGESINTLAGGFGALGKAIGEAFGPAAALAGSIVLVTSLNLIVATLEIAKGTIEAVAETLAGVFTGIGQSAQGMADIITGVINGDMAQAFAGMKGVLEGAATVADSVLGGINRLLGTTATSLARLGRNIAKDFGLDGFAATIDTLTEKITALSQGDFGLTFQAPQWIASLIAWAWPEYDAGWVTTLVDWDWPTFDSGAWLDGLLAWAWPEFTDKPGWLDSLMNFKWPSFERPAWLSQLLNWTWPTFHWPAFPDVPWWLGGGGGNDSGTTNPVKGVTGFGALSTVPGGQPQAATASADIYYQITINHPVVREDRDVRSLALDIVREIQRVRV